MPLDVIMPALGMSQDKGVLLAWHKSPGDPVKEGDPLFEVETDKATMEVEAQGSGFLTDVSAAAGDEIPVGQTVARISETAEDTATAPETAKAGPEKQESGAADEQLSPAIPEGEHVIMPALGMSQDAGQIVAWRKAPGDAVKASDILFEVETDKSVVEVEAGHDGYIAALLAEKGEDAPVGHVIAIITGEKPEAPFQQSLNSMGKSPEAAAPTDTDKPAQPEPAAKPAAKPVTPQRQPAAASKAAATGGRILASPKARRLALERGLDLARLAENGYPQPYHVKDLEILAQLPETQAPAASGPAPGRYLAADVPAQGFDEFTAWAAGEAGLTSTEALLAGFAGASLNRPVVTVALEAFGETRLFEVRGRRLGNVVELEAGAEPGTGPDLKVRDLRFGRLSKLQNGPEETPVLNILAAGENLTLTLECAAGHLGAPAAIALLSDFAGRMEQPLRHLL
jgi:pyruvate/2-oxoglutarate dehydrogenase complex dihydrolipoamide acyltransferase (E2) component